MSHCVEKLPHSCGSSDALQVFKDHDGGYSAYCFACSTYVPDPYGEGGRPVKGKLQRPVKSPEEVGQELAEIAKLPTLALDARALRAETLSYFGVHVSVSEVDGKTPEVAYYPFTKQGTITSFKAKLLSPKKIWVVGNFKEGVELFGWQQALSTGMKRLFITEGEEDACALYQALRDKQVGTQWTHLHPAVVSLTAGSGSVGKDLNAHIAVIRSNFKEVVFVFDMDDAGRKAVHDGLQIYPLAHSVTLPEKDANDCIIKGKAGALANACLFKTSIPKNTRVIVGSSVYEAGRQQASYGLSYPWEGFTKLTRGMRFGETYYLGAGVKMGKSTVRSALAAHLINHHGIKVFMAAPEETNRKTWQLVCSQTVGKIFHDPDVPFDFEAYDLASKTLGDNLFLLNLYQHLDWTSLRADIMAAVGQGTKAVFIDPITNLTNGIASGEANVALQEIAQELAALALDHQLIVWLCCHLKSPDSGDSHERGGKVLSHQFAGSRAMMRSCNMMVGLEGNKDPDLPMLIRNQRRLVVLEDREFGASGIVSLHYDINTGLYNELIEEKD